MKYLMLDHGGVLDGKLFRGTPGTNDLVLAQYEPGLYQLLPNRVSVVKKLDELVKNYGYQIAYHSKNIEEHQLGILAQLRSACQAKGIQFPAATAMAVCDPHQYPEVKSTQPTL